MASAQASTVSAEWFLARDGQQFGPLSDSELRKLVEFGHLKPTDLLWREGFPDWRSAHILLPDAAPPAPAGAQQPVADTSEPVAAPVTAPVTTPSAPAETPAEPVAAASLTAAEPAAAPNAASAPSDSVRASVPQAPHRAPMDHRPLSIPAPTAGVRLATPRPIAGPAPVPHQPPPGDPRRGPAAQPHQHVHLAAARQQPTARLAPIPSGPAPHQAGAPDPQVRSSGSMSHAPLSHSPMGQGPMAPAAMAPAPAPARTPAAPPAGDPRARGAAPVDRGQAKGVREGRAGLWAKRAAFIAFFLITLGAAGYAAYPYRDAATAWFAKATASVQPPTVSPLTGFSPSIETTDSAFQQAPFWRVTKKEFPDWYEVRVRDASLAARENKPAPETHKQLMQSVLELRRKHAGDALSATPPRLVALASAFADSLVQLRQVGVDACYGFIVGGETSPGYLAQLADPALNRPYQAQLVAMFEAIADGRQTPRVYPQPRQADYNQLVVLLEARGWTERDMALFSNSQAFGQAAPDKVCRMVTDWFQAQLEIKDKDAQIRLLADSLRPVVAG